MVFLSTLSQDCVKPQSELSRFDWLGLCEYAVRLDSKRLSCNKWYRYRLWGRLAVRQPADRVPLGPCGGCQPPRRMPSGPTYSMK